MKKTIIILSLTLATIGSIAQKDSAVKQSLPQFTDTTKFTLSYKEVQGLLNNLKAQITVQDNESFYKIFNYIVGVKQQEYEAKQKTKK